MASQPVLNTVTPDPAPAAVDDFDPLTDVREMPFEEWIVQLEPNMDETVGLVSPGYWSIGSLMICKKKRQRQARDAHATIQSSYPHNSTNLQLFLKITDGEELLADAVCSWSDEGATYFLQKRITPRVDQTPEGDFLVCRLPEFYGLSRGIWNLSPNVFCKAKSWVEGLTTEATTIRWVNEHVPSLPTEKVIYDWVDAEWNCTVMISKRVPGKTYQEAWKGLTKQQRLAVADQVAGHLKALSEMTSDHVETVQGTGLVGEYSLRVREPLPAWKPRLEPRVTREDYEAYAKRNNDAMGFEMELPDQGEPLVLQHPDCSPGNFLVTTPEDPNEMPKVTGIIDWERVGYLPKLYFAMNSRANPDFMVEQNYEGMDWQWMLSNALVRAGFPLELEYTKARYRVILDRKHPEIQVEQVINLNNLPAEVKAEEK